MSTAPRRDKTTVEERSNDDIGCSILATIDLIGERWTLGVLRCVAYGYRRFNEFERELGVATNILTDRLRKLVDAGVLQRIQYSERPPRFEYTLTDAGRELIPAFLLFKAWGDRHLQGEAGPYTTLVHERCGHQLDPQVMCAHCREPVRPSELSIHWLRKPADG